MGCVRRRGWTPGREHQGRRETRRQHHGEGPQVKAQEETTRVRGPRASRVLRSGSPHPPGLEVRATRRSLWDKQAPQESDTAEPTS